MLLFLIYNGMNHISKANQGDRAVFRHPLGMIFHFLLCSSEPAYGACDNVLIKLWLC